MEKKMFSKEDEKFLELYSDSKYEKPSVTVDGVIFRIKSEQNNNYRKLPLKKLQVFLTKRAFHPFKDKYSVVGTFIDLQHELGDTMKLCVKNKVGLENFYCEQLYTFGEMARDPRTRVLSVGYLMLTDENEKLKNGEWFDVELKEIDFKQRELKSGYEKCQNYKLVLKSDDITLTNSIVLKTKKVGLSEVKNLQVKNSSLAFDHLNIVFYALERLKNKLEYTDVIFNLLPKEFTLTELKQCYEIILNKKLLDANFRRKIAKMVLPVNRFDDAKGHRTSQLYCHNINWQDEGI